MPMLIWVDAVLADSVAVVGRDPTLHCYPATRCVPPRIHTLRYTHRLPRAVDSRSVFTR